MEARAAPPDFPLVTIVRVISRSTRINFGRVTRTGSTEQEAKREKNGQGTGGLGE